MIGFAALATGATVAHCAQRGFWRPIAAADNTIQCTPLQRSDENGWQKVAVGKIWSGVHTGIGTASVGNSLVAVAYYGPDRYVVLDVIDFAHGTDCRKELPSRFGGWDAHNAITLAVSDDGIIHLVGNMHASRMFYAAGRLTDLSSVQPRPMIGRDEESTTYPQFLRGRSGELFFIYRSGHAGNGVWIVNQWRGGRWLRIGPIFSDRDSHGPVSAYPTQFTLGNDGRFHVAIVWRRTYDINSNFAVSYASTADFRHWSGIGGQSFVGQLGPESLPPIEVPGENHGLVNNEVLVLDDSSRPIVIYSRYGNSGSNAVFSAEPVKGSWQVQQLATSKQRAVVAGTGTLSGLPILSLTDDCENGVAQVHVNFPPRDLNLISIDRRTSTVALNSPQCRDWISGFAFPRALIPGLASVSMMTAPVRQDGVGLLTHYLIYWFAQGANGDRPRECTKDAPLACAPPPSDLTLIARTG